MTAPETQIGILLGASGVIIAYCYLLSVRLTEASRKLDRVLEQFEGLRTYLYSIDPQFNDERDSSEEIDDAANLYGSYNDLKLLKEKEAKGRRTLNTPLA